MNYSLCRLKMLELMADNQWHRENEVLAAGTTGVTPGRAYRVGERSRTARQGSPGVRTRGDERDSIRAGAKMVARDSLRYLKHRRVSERVDNDGTVWLRLLPETVSLPDRVLELLREQPCTVEQAAEALDVSPSRVSYVRRALSASGLIQQVGTIPGKRQQVAVWGAV